MIISLDGWNSQVNQQEISLPCNLAKLHTERMCYTPAWWENRPNFFIGPQLPLYPCISSFCLLQFRHLCIATQPNKACILLKHSTLLACSN